MKHSLYVPHVVVGISLSKPDRLIIDEYVVIGQDYAQVQ